MAFDRITEQSSLYDNLQDMSAEELLCNINAEDRKVATAVERTIPQITTLVEGIIVRMKQGGRIFYLGAGTSGRLGVLDASEIPPTYGMPPTYVVGIIAGGYDALRRSIEGAEDDYEKGWNELLGYNVTSLDTVIGLAASGTTPYVIGALRHCREKGILTAAVCCNPESPVADAADIAIEAVTGPEFVTGSTRMKAGTAEKMILNMITTSVMIKIGRVKGNRMINMQLTNKKLVERGVRMIIEETGFDYEKAERLLLLHGSVKSALDSLKMRGTVL
ncbi:MAG: N-acetylmuramic acid 6-phosphate etherase [Bacteroidales bacterium]